MKFLLWFLFLISLSIFSVAEESSLDRIKSVKGPGAYAITGLERGGNISFGGYFDTEFSYGKNSSGQTESTFNNHHMIIEMAAQLHRDLLFNTEIEYEHAAGEIKIEQAWIDYRFADAFVQRMGVVVVPFGRGNVLHDSDVREMTDRSLYAEHIIPTKWSDTALGAYGYFELNNFEINYEGYVMNGLSGSITVDNGLRSARNLQEDDNNLNKAIVGRVGLSPFLGLELGTSGYYGAYSDNGEQKLKMLGFDGLWKWNSFEFIGEYALVKLDVLNSQAIIVPEEMYGYYIEARYKTAPDFLKKALRKFKQPTLTYFARIGALDTDVNNTTSLNDSRTDSERTRFAFGFNVRPISHVVYKAEYHINEEQGNKVDNNTFLASVAVGF